MVLSHNFFFHAIRNQSPIGWVSIEVVQSDIEEMRRSGGPGHYGDSGGNAYVNAQMQHMSGHRMEHKSDHYQGRQEPMTSDKGRSYGASKAEAQWRWERDGTKVPNAMSSQMFVEGKLYNFVSPFPPCLRAEISHSHNLCIMPLPLSKDNCLRNKHLSHKLD